MDSVSTKSAIACCFTHKSYSRIYFVRRSDDFRVWILYGFKWRSRTETVRTTYEIDLPPIRLTLGFLNRSWANSPQCCVVFIRNGRCATRVASWTSVFEVYSIFLINHAYDMILVCSFSTRDLIFPRQQFDLMRVRTIIHVTWISLG